MTSSLWPLPAFTFRVESDAMGRCSFQEVSGLDVSVSPLVDHETTSEVFRPVKMPGLRPISTVTLKRGVAEDSATILAWFQKSQHGTVQRNTVTLQLIDAEGQALMTWTLEGAWPTRFSFTDPEPGGQTLTIESLDLAYESLAIEQTPGPA